jgi:flavin reductase (DIM6/NTAB) family NADH-FMN oxidoreductase RutF
MKTINPSELSPMQVQMILQTAVSPRPIALVSTIDKNGNVNLSPFNFYFELVELYKLLLTPNPQRFSFNYVA